MKLIHCSDLHLDSKMETNLSKDKARERNYEVFLTFKRLVSYAKENGVDVILLAGDMFDEKRVSRTMIQLVCDTISQAEDIDFLYLKGNHDDEANIYEDIFKLKNVKAFGEQWTYYDYDSVTIAGIEISRDNCYTMYESLSLEKDRTNIVMLHGQEAAVAGEELVCINNFRGKNINYLALGHLHAYKIESLDSDGTYCYCGCLEGRGFDECGEKGFVLLEVNGKNISSTFVPFASRILHEVETDISGLITVNEILDAIESQTTDIPNEDLVKIVLRGTYTTDTNKDIEFLKKVLADRFYFVKIKDESKLLIDVGDYAYDKTLKGEFIRAVLASDKSETDCERIINCGLAALKGERIDL